MNLFVLDKDTTIAARAHNDVHVRKMAVEAAQLLSTAVAVLHPGCKHLVPSKNGKKYLTKYFQVDGLYKPTHWNHPCCKWIRESEANATWAYYLGLDLLSESEYRGFKVSENTKAVIRNICNFWYLFPKIPATPFVIAINKEKYPNIVHYPDDPVRSYRQYYKEAKSSFKTKGEATWTLRSKPDWM